MGQALQRKRIARDSVLKRYQSNIARLVAALADISSLRKATELELMRQRLMLQRVQYARDSEEAATGGRPSRYVPVVPNRVRTIKVGSETAYSGEVPDDAE